jgi:hypothetical protein
MILATRVRVFLAEDPQIHLANVRVALYDRDEGDPDDFLAEGVTGQRGETALTFESEDFMDAEDHDPWRTSSLPDLYVVVLNAAGAPVFSTRQQYRKDDLPRRLEVGVPQALAEEHGLFRVG